MNFGNLILISIVGAVAVISITWLVRHYFSAAARYERRRRRSNTPISTKSTRPTVKFSVKTKNDRRK
jgi:hypothetical protein